MPTSVTLRWLGPPTRCAPAAILDALTPLTERYRLHLDTRRARTRTYLDTADWRIRRNGLVLSHEVVTGPGSLVLHGGEEPVTARLSEPPSWPARAEQLAPGPVRDGIAGAISVRAVAPKLRCRTVTREIAVRKADGSTVLL
ncbi:hypothetical protein FNH05_34650, partial [Amycolatopsis rhizosphaerae]